MTSSAAKRILRASTLDELRAEAERVLKNKKLAKARRRERAAPDAKREAEVAAAIDAEVKARREYVVSRARGACEVCHGTDLRLELDHLVSGGLRRHRESAETMVHACMDCHRARHRGDRATLRAYKATCLRLGLREGLQAIEYRLQKMEGR